MTKTILALVWMAGWAHVIWLTPDDGSSIGEFLASVMQPDTEQLDPLVFCVFNALGLWPLIMLAMLAQDVQGRLKAWPFALSSMVLGNSALYVYLFLRRPQTGASAPRTRMVRFAESKWLAAFLLAATSALCIQALMFGSLEAYVQSYRTNAFVNFMTIDFFLFPIAFAAVLPDDLRRRGMSASASHWLYAMVPALGAVVYLFVRKPLTPQQNR